MKNTMENYEKAENVEEPLEKEKIPIPNLPDNFIWMQVRGSSKIRNLLEFALKEFPEAKSIVWTGFGPACDKTITCVEIMKRKFSNKLHQYTRICYRQVEEYWRPLLPDLEAIIVKRKLPMVHVCLTLEPLPNKDPGYQPPGITKPFERPSTSSGSGKRPPYKKSKNKSLNQKPNSKEGAG